MLKILAFAGSSMKESFNKKLLKIAALGVQEQGGYVTLIDLADNPMSILIKTWSKNKGYQRMHVSLNNLWLSIMLL